MDWLNLPMLGKIAGRSAFDTPTQEARVARYGLWLFGNLPCSSWDASAAKMAVPDSPSWAPRVAQLGKRQSRLCNQVGCRTESRLLKKPHRVRDGRLGFSQTSGCQKKRSQEHQVIKQKSWFHFKTSAISLGNRVSGVHSSFRREPASAVAAIKNELGC